MTSIFNSCKDTIQYRRLKGIVKLAEKDPLNEIINDFDKEYNYNEIENNQFMAGYYNPSFIG